MANFFGFHIPGTKRNNPSKEVGGTGTAVHGGIVDSGEKNNAVIGDKRYDTAAEILANVSVVAASLRYFLNLLANPKWTVAPADDSPEALAHAKFVEQVIEEMDTSWTKTIRKVGMYKFHGFGIYEWTARKREDGSIGMANIEVRPQHTIARWELDEETGRVLGVWQRPPQSGVEIPIDRWKFIYLVDDVLTDSPEGMGWFRHLVEPSTRLKELLRLEKTGYERDLAGIPVGRAPITAINRSVQAGKMTRAEGDRLLKGLSDFVKMEVKQKNTGLILDSQTYENQTSDGSQASSVDQWGIDLLTSQAGSMAQLGASIHRLNVEMSRIIGTENIFTGSDGTGSLALSKDKSTNLYLNVNATLDEIAEQFTADFIGAIWALNGFDKKLKPTFSTEEVAFKDVEMIATVLKELANAGAVLAPDDPAIDELREMLGVSRQEAPPFD